jgi:hypothetical protein
LFDTLYFFPFFDVRITSVYGSVPALDLPPYSSAKTISLKVTDPATTLIGFPKF